MIAIALSIWEAIVGVTVNAQLGKGSGGGAGGGRFGFLMIIGR